MKDEEILDLAEKHLTPDFGDVLEFARALLYRASTAEPTASMLDAGAMQIAMNQQRVMTAEQKSRLVYLAMMRAAS